MLTSFVTATVALVLAATTGAPPPTESADLSQLGCMLVVDRQNKMGGSRIESSGFVGTALSRTDYVIDHDGERVVSFGWGPSRLSQLTWRPPQVAGEGPTASFNCTTTQGGQDPPADRERLGLMCLIDDELLLTGIDAITVQRGEIRYSALARTFELRVAIDGGPAGFVSAWTHEAQSFGGGRTIQAAGHTLTCWRL